MWRVQKRWNGGLAAISACTRSASTSYANTSSIASYCMVVGRCARTAEIGKHSPGLHSMRFASAPPGGFALTRPRWIT